jgi:hypothetical protein
VCIFCTSFFAYQRVGDRMGYLSGLQWRGRLSLTLGPFLHGVHEVLGIVAHLLYF